MIVSKRSLVLLAALVWLIGGVVLLLKASGLLVEASALGPNGVWPWLALVIGLLIGAVKARFLFSRSCRRNLDRIAALTEPRIWQFYRAWFFAALALMIMFSAVISRTAEGSYYGMLGVAILDLAIGSALLGSSPVFLRHRVTSR